jgi:hypothetical protein
MDIKKIDSDGKSLLHNICADSQFKELSVLDAMIRGGVDPNMTDRFGNSAAYYALKYKYHCNITQHSWSLRETTWQRLQDYRGSRRDVRSS